MGERVEGLAKDGQGIAKGGEARWRGGAGGEVGRGWVE